MTVSHEGGDVFPASDWARLRRFLIIGSSAGTYYVAPRELTIENCRVVIRCLKEDPERTIGEVVNVSVNGIAPRNDPCLMALAMATFSKDEGVRKCAWGAVPLVARIGTHLFHFLDYRKAIAGKMTTSRMGRTAMAGWYGAKEPMALAYELTKYRQRDGVGHDDVLRLYHPKPPTEDHSALYEYTVDGCVSMETGMILATKQRDWLDYYGAVIEIGKTESAERAAVLISEHGLPREVVPTPFLNDWSVWAALAGRMPMTAMIRNLGKMTAVGLFEDQAWVDMAMDRLTDKDLLAKARVHPLDILLAARVYAQGHGDKGKLSWTPKKGILAALDAAFPLAFSSVEPTGKKLCLAVDTSRSMCAPTSVGLTSREIGAAMALITASVEEDVHLLGFSGHLSPLPIQKGMSLAEVTGKVLALDANTTYCRLPIEHCRTEKLAVDGFIFFTDGETADGRYGASHTFSEALRRYRSDVAPAKLVVVEAAANDVTLLDPDDVLSLSVAGFGSDVPAVISGFLGGS